MGERNAAPKFRGHLLTLLFGAYETSLSCEGVKIQTNVQGNVKRKLINMKCSSCVSFSIHYFYISNFHLLAGAPKILTDQTAPLMVQYFPGTRLLLKVLWFHRLTF